MSTEIETESESIRNSSTMLLSTAPANETQERDQQGPSSVIALANENTYNGQEVAAAVNDDEKYLAEVKLTRKLLFSMI